jgi:ferric-dicitrate binding protein FerR (iron transport regulator)
LQFSNRCWHAPQPRNSELWRVECTAWRNLKRLANASSQGSIECVDRIGHHARQQFLEVAAGSCMCIAIAGRSKHNQRLLLLDPQSRNNPDSGGQKESLTCKPFELK